MEEKINYQRTDPALWASTKFRPDIEGLRGLAIVLVVLFHAFPNIFSGGFIGVDIFFVISGFLITNNITSNLERKTFSFYEFYCRRIVRIFPALCFVILCTSILGNYVLFPAELHNLGKEVAGGAGFVSNLFFWKEDGYFEGASETKPYLHLWSIGVEEQFYILWPFLLWFCFRSNLRTPFILFVIALSSFVFCLYWTYHNVLVAFFFPFSRIWELALGGLVSYITMNGTNPIGVMQRRKIAEGFPLVAFILILISTFFVNKEFAIPGAWTLIPTLGAVIFILSSPTVFFNKYVLSNSVMRWLGLISYPLYLWHWPILCFVRFHFQKDPNAIVMLVLVAMNLFLAQLTYLLVERPIQKAGRSANHRLKTVASLFIANAFLFTLGMVIWKVDSISHITDNHRFNEHVRINLQLMEWEYWTTEGCISKYSPRRKLPWWICNENSKNEATILILGDSHANSLYVGFVNNESLKNKSILNIGACNPILGVKINEKYQPKDSPCDYMEDIGEFYKTFSGTQKSARYAVLTARWISFNETGAASGNLQLSPLEEADKTLSDRDLFIKGLDRFVTLLESKGIQVVLALDIPHMPDGRVANACLIPRPLSGLTRYLAQKDCEFKTEEYHSSNFMKEVGTHLQKKHPELKMFDPTPAFCVENLCNAHNDDGKILFRDSDHLSAIGSEFYAKMFVEWAKINLPKILEPEF